MQNSPTNSIRPRFYDASVYETLVKELGYGTIPTTQPLGGTQGTQGLTLGQWYDRSYNYYQAVMSGVEQVEDQTSWNEFLNQLQWAADRLGLEQGAQWDPMAGGFGGAAQQPSVPQGAILGTLNNVVWNAPEAHITWNGDPRVQDIWSNDVTIDIPSLSASVTSEITSDDRFQPAEDIVKIIVRDPATGTETVYFVHDYEDAKVKLRTPLQNQVTDSTDSVAPDLVSWEEYKAGAAGGSHGESSIPGVKNANNELEYIPDSYSLEETIDFWAQPGEDQTHIVFANANIMMKPSDHVTVVKNIDGSVTVTALHNDGSTDTWKIQKGYKVNIQVNEAYVTFGPGNEGDPMPADYSDVVTLNSNVTGSGQASGATGHGDAADAKVENFINAFQDPTITYQDLEGAGLIEEIIYEKDYPSEEMLKFILEHDHEMKYQAKGAHIKEMTERLALFLTSLGYNVEAGVAAPSDAADDALGEANNISINGTTFNIRPTNPADWEQGFTLSDFIANPSTPQP